METNGEAPPAGPDPGGLDKPHSRQSYMGQQADSRLDRCISLYVRHPHKCCGIGTVILFLLTAGAMMTKSMEPARSGASWLVWEYEATQMFKAHEKAVEASTGKPKEYRFDRRLSASGDVDLDADDGMLPEDVFLAPLENRVHANSGMGRRLEDGWQWQTLILYYKTNKDGTGMVFTRERLRTICLLEKDVIQKWIKIEKEGTEHRFNAYKPPASTALTTMFYGSGSQEPKDRSVENYDWKCDLLAQSSVDKTVSAMWDSVKILKVKSPYAKYVNPSFLATGKTAFTRSMMVFNVAPAQEDTDDNGMKLVMQPIFDALGVSYGFRRSAFEGDDDDRFTTHDDLRVRMYYSGLNEFRMMTSNDMLFSVGAVFIVFILMYVHIGSSFVALCGMMQIGLSLPISAFLYKYILQVHYFETLHVLILYLILGIGADDIFVLFDTFKTMSQEYFPGYSGGRLNDDQLQQVLKSTIYRSATAIFNTSFTTAAAFMSCSVSKVMPMRTLGWFAAVCIFFNYFVTQLWLPSVLVIWQKRLQKKRCCCPSWSLREEGSIPEEEVQVPMRIGLLDKILQKAYTPAMSYQIGSMGIRPVPTFVFLVLLAHAAQGIAFASQLTPPRKEETWWPERHMTNKRQQLENNQYYSPDFDGFSVMQFTWGITGLDMSEHTPYDPSGTPVKPVYDTSFDISTAAAQQEILDICDALEKVPCNLPGCGASTGTLMLGGEGKAISCFMRDFRNHTNNKVLTGKAFIDALKKFRDEKDARDYTGDPLKREVDYKEDIGFLGDRVAFASVKIRSTMPWETPYGNGVEIRKWVNKWTDERAAIAPQGMKSLKTVVMIFSWFDLGDELIQGLFSGCIIAGPVTFLVLITSTQNFLVALYAVFSVGSVVMCVLGFCKSAFDWDLGMGEAIAGVIVIGYSVDYVVHLAHTYCEGLRGGLETRDACAKFAIKHMGPPVFAGAITTVGSGVIMFLCYTTFFTKMAVLICVTIINSFLFSLGFFMSLLWIMGPQGRCGDISFVCQRFTNKFVALKREKDMTSADKTQKANGTDQGLEAGAPDQKTLDSA